MDKVYTYTIRAYNIDYYVGAEDIDEGYDIPDEEIEMRIEQIKSQLESELILEVEATEEDLEWVIADAISEETGWLIEGFSYEVLSKENA